MKTLRLLFATVALLAIATPAFAEKDKDKADKAKPAADKERTMTVTGEGKCGKCALKETEKCQNVIEAENKAGKKVTYYLADNQVSKDFHKVLCKESKQVKATGTVKREGKGKLQLTATKIEEAK